MNNLIFTIDIRVNTWYNIPQKGGNRMYARNLIKLLQQNGWYKVSQKGSHLKMRKRKSNRNYPST